MEGRQEGEKAQPPGQARKGGQTNEEGRKGEKRGFGREIIGNYMKHERGKRKKGETSGEGEGYVEVWKGGEIIGWVARGGS